MMRYEHVMAYVAETPWAILPSKLDAILTVLATRAAGETIDAAEIESIVGAAARRDAPRAGAAVAVLPLFGVISHRAGTLKESSGGTSTERFGAALRQAVADPGISAIVLDVDSPGGTVSGVPELAADLFRARGRKPIVAVANALAASAAYWVAAQADELVVAPSAQVGSIGVMSAHTDVSKALEMRGIKTSYITSAKYKVEGAPDMPLSAEAGGHIQSQVDYYHGLFVRAVARGRGVPVADVRGERFGEGRVYHAAAAVERGMADRIATLDQVIGELAAGQWSRPMRGQATIATVSGTTAITVTTGSPLVWDGTDPTAEWVKPPEIVEDEPDHVASIEYRRRRLRVLAAR